MKILFADDHFLILEGLKELLQKEIPSITVLTSDNKEDLFEKLRVNKIDILIQDLKFGDYNASDFLNEIISSYPNIKIIMLSSVSDASTIQKLFKKTDGYILKTEPTKIILSGIQEVLDNEKFLSPQAKKITNQLFKNETEIPLTRRELDVVKEIMKEFPTKSIAKNLQISEKTVEMHRANIYLKLEVSNMTGLVKKVIGLGIIDN